MINQEASFAHRERHKVSARPINTDPREQREVQVQVDEYRELYGAPEYRQMGDGKVQPPRPKNRGPMIVLALLLVALVVLGKGISVARDQAPLVQHTETHSFVVATQPELSISNDSGTTHIHTGNAGKIIVQATKYVRGIGIEPNVHYSQDHGSIDVSVKESSPLFLGSVSVDLDITVPSAANVSVDSDSGAVDISGVTGQIDLETEHGAITASNLRGQDDGISLTTSSGKITASNLSSTPDGEVKLETDSGTIDFNGALEPRGSYSFATDKGTINLTLPASSAFRLDASTGSGSLNNDFGSDIVGDGPRAELNVETSSGSINLRKSP